MNIDKNKLLTYLMFDIYIYYNHITSYKSNKYDLSTETNINYSKYNLFFICKLCIMILLLDVQFKM